MLTCLFLNISDSRKYKHGTRQSFFCNNFHIFAIFAVEFFTPLHFLSILVSRATCHAWQQFSPLVTGNHQEMLISLVFALFLMLQDVSNPFWWHLSLHYSGHICIVSHSCSSWNWNLWVKITDNFFAYIMWTNRRNSENSWAR